MGLQPALAPRREGVMSDKEHRVWSAWQQTAVGCSGSSSIGDLQGADSALNRG